MESVVDIYFRGDLFKTVGISQNASLDKLRKAANLHSWAAFIQNGQQIPSFLEIEPVTEQGKKENKKVYYVSDIIQDGKVYTEIRQAMFETSVRS